MNAMSSTPPSPPNFVACPACGQQLAAPAEAWGRKGKCSRCGKVFRIGAAEVEDRDQRSRLYGESATVSFSCELCQTRLTASVADVGRPVECPDCGRRNVIPARTPRP